MKKPRAAPAGQAGQSVLEFAFALPFLALLLIGAASLGKYAYEAQIVRQTMIETGKLAINDRTKDSTSTAYQLSNTDLFRWLRTAAHEQDNSIAGTDLVLPQSGFGNCSPGNECSAWQYKPGVDPHDDGELNDIKSSLNIGLAIHKGNCSNDTANVIAFLNPGLETMRVNFQYNTGLGGGWRISPRTFTYNFSRYQMLSFPLNFPEGGCVTDDGFAP